MKEEDDYEEVDSKPIQAKYSVQSSDSLDPQKVLNCWKQVEPELKLDLGLEDTKAAQIKRHSSRKATPANKSGDAATRAALAQLSRESESQIKKLYNDDKSKTPGKFFWSILIY